MEAAQFWDLLANWRPGRTNGVISVQKPTGLDPRGDCCFSSCPKAGRIWCPSRKAVNQQEKFLTQKRISLLLYSGLHLIGWDPLRIGRAICFTHSTTLYLSLVQSFLTDTLGVMFDLSMPGNSLAQSSWHIIFIIMLLCHCEAPILENLDYLSNFTHSPNISNLPLK